MDRSAKKRKAPASSPETREAKRQKTPEPFYVPKTAETKESVYEVGQDFFQSLRKARDKNSRLISTHFLTLPSKKDFPDYYELTAMPLAIDTLEAKLERREYSKLTQIESDMKRMVNNAKAYNHNKSDVFLDAEKIRKMTFNYMVKHNPAYKDKGYTAFATPIPAYTGTLATAEDGESDVDAEGEPDEEEPAKAVTTTIGKAQAKPKAEVSTPAPAESSRKTRGGAATPHESLKRTQSEVAALDPDDPAYDADYTGKTFQQAQRQLLNEMIKYKNEEDLEIFTPFLNLPPRSLTEYYEVIQQPTSLRSVMNKVIGFHGRAGATGITELKSWEALENEMSKIWENCREYNQEGSEIYELAGELETYWNERLAAAKAKVEEPPQPAQAKLKLNLAAKAAPIKLRLGAKASPSPAPATLPEPAKTTTPPKPATTISLQVPAATTRQSPAKASASPAPSSRPANARTTSAASPSNVKAEATPTPAPAPAPAATNPTSSSVVPPTTSTPALKPTTPAAPAQPTPAIQPYVPFHAPTAGLESKWRPEGKTLTDALISSLQITTHPSLSLSNPFTYHLPASPLLSHHLLTLTLPYTHSILQFEPSLHPSLGGSGSTTSTAAATTNGTTPTPAPAPVPSHERRPYKLFVLVNGQRVQANFLPGQARLQYDVRLGVGLNRVEVECVALAVGERQQMQVSPGTRGEALEVERVGVFVNILRM